MNHVTSVHLHAFDQAGQEQWGVPEVDFESLRQIDRLFEHRWEAFVIASLAAADRPLRFNQLAHVVSECCGTRMIDSTLTRIKNRLVHRGYLRATHDSTGHHAWILTDKGHARANILIAITDALAACAQNSDRENGDVASTVTSEESPPP